MAEMPRDKNIDSTIPFLLDPYEFISKRCHQYNTDIFQTRIAFQTTICMMGRECAEVFYDSTRFTREDAAPEPVVKTLFGQGGVQALNGEAHRHRKHMFTSLLMDPENVKHLIEVIKAQWHTAARRWSRMETITLYDEIRRTLMQAVCEWAGVPLDEAKVKWRTSQITALFNDAGSLGPKHLWSRLARKLANGWAETQINNIRTNPLAAPEGSAVRVIALHHDSDGNKLLSHIAAVELLNILRPTVAISVYILFAVHALHLYPAVRQALSEGDEMYLGWFIQEVRRFYPFFPAVTARVRHDFDYQGYQFNQGTRVLLDLYGTNHDARLWTNPDEFLPERFAKWDGDLFNLIPQGGSAMTTHRCPGENITLEVMKAATDFFCNEITYEMPKQNMQINASRLPALPRSHIMISKVRISHDTTPKTVAR